MLPGRFLMNTALSVLIGLQKRPIPFISPYPDGINITLPDYPQLTQVRPQLLVFNR